MSSPQDNLGRMPDFTPFVVFGPSKSGTTWLQKLIDSHPEARCHFQLPLFTIPREKAVTYPGSSPKWLFSPDRSITKPSASPFDDVFDSTNDEDRYNDQLAFITSIREFIHEEMQAPSMTDQPARQMRLDAYRAISRHFLCDDHEARVFGTKAYTDLEFLFDLYPGARVVNIVRDGRDVAVSKRFHYLRSGIYHSGDEVHRLHRLANSAAPLSRLFGVLDRRLGLLGTGAYRDAANTPPLFTKDALHQIAADWQRAIDYILSWQCTKPSQMLMIRYEDLLVDPVETMTRVYDFLAIDTSVSTVTTAVKCNEFTRLQKAGSSSFFRKGQIGDWSNHFTDEDKHLFKEIAGPQLIKLDYERGNAW